MSNTKNDNTKKEHYVSRFYLEKFGNLSPSQKECKIWVFNKRSLQLPYSSDVKDTATGRYFYDFPIELVGEDNNKIFDEDLQKLENIIAPFYKKFEMRISYILKLCDKQKHQSKIISKRQKKSWSYILAIQALRTPDFRNLLKEVKQKAEDANLIQDSLEKKIYAETKHLQNYYPELNIETIDAIQNFWNQITIKIIDELYAKNLIAINHYDFFQEHFRNLSNIFLKHKWSIGVNQTGIPFYTSDHPIVRIPYFETGYASEGIEVLYPINSKIILILRDKKHPRSNEGDCKLVNLSENEVTNYNKAQVYCSNQFIYCQENKFELAQNNCKMEPDVCSEVKNRVKFVNK